MACGTRDGPPAWGVWTSAHPVLSPRTVTSYGPRPLNGRVGRRTGGMEGRLLWGRCPRSRGHAADSAGGAGDSMGTRQPRACGVVTRHYHPDHGRPLRWNLKHCVLCDMPPFPWTFSRFPHAMLDARPRSHGTHRREFVEGPGARPCSRMRPSPMDRFPRCRTGTGTATCINEKVAAGIERLLISVHSACRAGLADSGSAVSGLRRAGSGREGDLQSRGTSPCFGGVGG